MVGGIGEAAREARPGGHGAVEAGDGPIEIGDQRGPPLAGIARRRSIRQGSEPTRHLLALLVAHRPTLPKHGGASGSVPPVTGSLAIAFPGQGGDWNAAIATLAERSDHPLVRAAADRLGTDDWASLDGLDTRNAQPAIYVAGLVGPGADARGVALAVGHSLGEITAAAWAGALDPIAGLDLVVERGALGHRLHAARPGAMAAINRWEAPEVDQLRRAIVAELGGVLEVAVTNSATQLVLSGDEALVDAAVVRANEAGAVARRLPIGGAYHSSLLEPAVAGFRDRLLAAVEADPAVPVVSSTLQRPLTTAAELVDGLAQSLVLAVDWPATIDAVVAAGATRAIEAGPGSTLRRLARFAPALEIVAP